jgi:hypothetical protein
MKKSNRFMLVGVVLAVSVMCLAFARADEDSDGLHLKADIAAAPGSGITGTAVVDIGEDGLHGKVKADNLTPGHGYTVWFFYLEGGATAGPGRFDSTVAEDDDFTFRGRVGGLRVASGGTIRLVIFDHPSLGATDVTRANNLLTPVGGSMAGQAVFTIP